MANPMICETCKKEFVPSRRSKGRFCSVKCNAPLAKAWPREDAVLLYNSGMGCTRISKRLGVNEGTIIYYLKRRGIFIPKPKDFCWNRGMRSEKRWNSERLQNEAWKREWIHVRDTYWHNHPAINAYKALKYDKDHPEKRRARWKRGQQAKTNYHISKLIRSRVYSVLKGIKKSAPTLSLLGCSMEQLRAHIEGQFKRGMRWDNHGLHGWHIDHIVPCDAFDLSDPKQQRQCFHFTNLQPMWASENWVKRNRIVQCQPALPI